MVFEVPLYPHQDRLVREVYGHYRAGRRTVLLQSPVGSGKTRKGARIIGDALNRSRRTLFLAHRKELVTQPRDTLAEFGIECGIIKAGFEFRPDLPCQIASVQTLAGRLDQIHAPDLIVVDEAHHSTAGTWDRILAAFPQSKVLGLSGSPERADGTGLGETFEVMVDGPQIPWLIKHGYLVDCDVIGAGDRIDIPRPRSGDYNPQEVLKAIERKGLDGDPLVQFQRNFTRGERVVAFGPTVEFCNVQARRFRAAGIAAQALSGATKDEARDAILAGLTTGETQVVWNVDVIGEGTDIPALEGLIDCARTTSFVRYIQRAGRILRTCDGKSRGVYIDMVGNAVEHGHPCIERRFSLSGEAARKRRLEEMTEDGEHLSSRQCKRCRQHYIAARHCTYCGHDNGQDRRVPAIRAAEMRKLEKEEIAQAREAARKARLAEEHACNSLAEIRALGARRGNKPGWAFKRWQHVGKMKGKSAASAKPAEVQMKIGLDGWPT